MNTNPPSVNTQTDYQFTDILPGKYTLFVETDARGSLLKFTNDAPFYS